MASQYEMFREHALDHFADILLALSKDPAMILWLDNKDSTKDNLNENYGRELLELFSMGIGNYTEDDVKASARAFTGWTVKNFYPAQPFGYFDADFEYRDDLHDQGEKTFLGQTGTWNGEDIIRIIVAHPATARFVATKLARRFVADEPPPALVERGAAVFHETDGDIRAVVGAVVRAPEFWSADAYRGKVKTPLEFAVSALRALGAETDAGAPVQRALLSAGQPLYGAQPRAGYPDRAEAWVSPGGLLARLNFAQAVVAGRLAGSRVDLAGLAAGEGGAAGLADRLIARLLGGEVSAETRAVLDEALAEPSVLRAVLDDPAATPDVAKVAALVLGSPEFQRR
jgi:uncharacterized protein (DUF1800 family)